MRQVILEQREQIQVDLLCIVDGFDDPYLEQQLCDVIVDRFKIILDSLED